MNEARKCVKQKKRIYYIFAMMIIITLPIVISQVIIPIYNWDNEPLHSVLESIGALSCILMCMFLIYSTRERKKVFLVAMGFLSMGILGVFHAVCRPGQAFVFLHSIAGLFGGVGFFLGCFSKLNKIVSKNMWISWIVCVISILIGVWGLSFPETLPNMLYYGDFTSLAIIITLVGGVLFFAVYLYFVFKFYRTGNTESYLFACFSLLFTLSGLLFGYSTLWNSQWWLWHLLQLTAYILLLMFIFRGYYLVLYELRNFNKQLKLDIIERKQVAEQIADLAKFPEENTNPVYRVSSKGVLLYANPASRKLMKDDYFEEGNYISKKWVKMIKDIYISGKKHKIEIELNGRMFLFEHIPIIEKGYVNVYATDISERVKATVKLKESIRKQQISLKYLESMDIINRSTSKWFDLENMIKQVIKDVYNIFNVDRAWMLHSCDPDSSVFQVFYEFTNHEYPGAGILNTDISMDKGSKEMLKDTVLTSEPKIYDLSNSSWAESVAVTKFHARSQIVIAINPKIGKPWCLGMHQCSYERAWTQDEIKLFKDISLKAADVLTNILLIQNIRKSEEELEASKTFLDTVVDMSPFAMWVSDREGTLIRSNFSLRQFLNLSDDKIVGKYNVLKDLNLKKKGLLPRVKSVFEKHDFVRFNMQWNPEDAGEVDIKGGRVLYIDVSMFPILNIKGELINVICQWVDITERINAENEVRRYNLELTRSNKELEQFAYVASHDLQEPLRMVSSFTQLLGKKYKDKIDKDANEYINYAVDGANRMQILINDLLEYSRISTHSKSFDNVDLYSVLGQARFSLRYSIEEASVIITNDDLPIVKIDESQIVRVFQNIIGNAIKFHADKTTHIHVAAHEKDGSSRKSVLLI